MLDITNGLLPLKCNFRVMFVNRFFISMTYFKNVYTVVFIRLKKIKV